MRRQGHGGDVLTDREEQTVRQAAVRLSLLCNLLQTRIQRVQAQEVVVSFDGFLKLVIDATKIGN